MVAAESLILVFSALFGAIVGSFLNVVILRLPKEDTSIVFPASHCPKCEHPLAWYENIPVISYIVQLGKCRHCKTSISLQYPTVELIMAVLTAALVNHFGLSAAFAGYFIFTAALIAIIYIDIHLQIIPDVISLPGIVLGFLFSFINPYVSWQSSLIGILAGGGILFAIAEGYAYLRKMEGMGGGDIKLLAMLGAFLGWQSLPFIFLASSLSGSIVGLMAMPIQKKGGQTRIPFGPFLSLAGLCYMFFSTQILYYFNLYLNGQWP
ncbi:prepilin peptidase [Desulfosediminicola flagellatus]|uniref:prepilin peptidase n=1 Tax=Desulfosediminicola flagellatus TaxID=2569541 RepID=UPI0010AC707C|nr:A24 family peptidase [Desulfosediminicola flagellatus]